MLFFAACQNDDQIIAEIPYMQVCPNKQDAYELRRAPAVAEALLRSRLSGAGVLFTLRCIFANWRLVTTS